MASLEAWGSVPSGRVAPQSALARRERVVELDGLRGLAALVVVVAHYFGEVPSGISALTAGWLGVDVFFVLSGYLIGSLILENRHAPNFFSVFFLRRACRILPVYLVTISAVFLALALLGPGRSTRPCRSRPI